MKAHATLTLLKYAIQNTNDNNDNNIWPYYYILSRLCAFELVILFSNFNRVEGGKKKDEKKKH